MMTNTAFTYDTFSPRAGVTLAYRKTPAQNTNLSGVIFLGGYRSDMTGTKAAYLEDFCKNRGQGFVRFDYTGHGFSGGNFIDGTIGGWLQDALDVFDTHTQGPQIVIGSSMGGWISLLLAQKRAKRMAGWVGIAPAPDFSEDIYHHELTDAQRAEIMENGVTYLQNAYGDPHPVTRKLVEEARGHLLLDTRIHLPFPARILHSKLDDAVPWQKSLKIKSCATSPDMQVTLIEDGDHRLSRDADLRWLGETVAALSQKTGL